MKNLDFEFIAVGATFHLSFEREISSGSDVNAGAPEPPKRKSSRYIAFGRKGRISAYNAGATDVPITPSGVRE
jgi:hypothetical protein